jgi:hypothetical protein
MANMREKQGINCIDRSRATLIRGKASVSDYVDRPAAECVAMVWELTQELWSISGRKDAQRRLQRNVVTLKKRSRN